MSNDKLFASWEGLSDSELSTELARHTGVLLEKHREDEIERGTTVWQLKDSGDMLAHRFLMEAFGALRLKRFQKSRPKISRKSRAINLS
jgi:hypothetical protein